MKKLLLVVSAVAAITFTACVPVSPAPRPDSALASVSLQVYGTVVRAEWSQQLASVADVTVRWFVNDSEAETVRVPSSQLRVSRRARHGDRISAEIRFGDGKWQLLRAVEVP